jgi:hypothetical protein
MVETWVAIPIAVQDVIPARPDGLQVHTDAEITTQVPVEMASNIPLDLYV